MPSSFREEDFQRFCYFFPFGCNRRVMGGIQSLEQLCQGHDMNNLGTSPLGDASYQISTCEPPPPPPGGASFEARGII